MMLQQEFRFRFHGIEQLQQQFEMNVEGAEVESWGFLGTLARGRVGERGLNPTNPNL